MILSADCCDMSLLQSQIPRKGTLTLERGIPPCELRKNRAACRPYRWLTRDDDVCVPPKRCLYRLLEEVPEAGYGDRDAGNMLIQGDT